MLIGRRLLDLPELEGRVEPNLLLEGLLFSVTSDSQQNCDHCLLYECLNFHRVSAELYGHSPVRTGDTNVWKHFVVELKSTISSTPNQGLWL